MKRYFLLFLLFGVSANAATMCVPDLSTCESCAAVSYSGTQWVANCCGVRVSGIGFWLGDFVRPYTQSVPQSISYEQREDGQNYVCCLMTYPFVPDYYHVPILSNTRSSIVGDWCSRLFNPRCAIVGCDLAIDFDDNYTDPT